MYKIAETNGLHAGECIHRDQTHAYMFECADTCVTKHLHVFELVFQAVGFAAGDGHLSLEVRHLIEEGVLFLLQFVDAIVVAAAHGAQLHRPVKDRLLETDRGQRHVNGTCESGWSDCM